MSAHRFTLTIKQRLIALIALSTISIVGTLAIYFTSRQIDEITNNLRGKAASYADLAAKQTTSAVAFSDRETAREVLTSIASDPDLESATLFGEHGERLFEYGTPSAWVANATKATTPKTIETGSRVATVTPVVSLEGPRGTLVLEMSTERVAHVRTRLVWTAIASGSVALCLAVLMAWLIARSVARRLRAIANVATAVAGGDLSQEPVQDTRRDEIGVLASAFNAMLSQIKQLIERVRDLARQEQERLETLVAERTAALDTRNAEMRLVFDHVDQGLLVVALDGTIACEHSNAVERWLGSIPDSYALVDFVRSFAPAGADWFAATWSMLAEDVMPLEVCIAQLPARFTVGERHLFWSYQPFVATSGATHVLVKITDVTAEVERERSERDERETASMFSRMLRDRAGFVACREEATRLVAEIESDATDRATFLRAVHTLKGMCGILELASIAEPCHALETAHAENDHDVVRVCRTEVVARWRFLAGKTKPLLAEATGRIDVFETDLVQLEATIARGASQVELVGFVETWRHERATSPLYRLAEQAHSLAARLGKSPITVTVETDPNLRLPTAWSPIWSAFGHAIRNAIDHGVEPPEERVAAGKPEAGTLTLRAHADHGAIIVELTDDGRGIQWDRVAAAARLRGLPTGRTELEAALFVDGLSTREEVTEISGRGVGMGALREACEQSGGQLAFATSAGGGTAVRFTWPIPHARSFSPPLAVLRVF
jgi:two-component system, chemotaxis family, sensor kinase CheA